MNTIYRTGLIGLVALFTRTAQAQEPTRDYIVTMKEDTVFGQFSKRLMGFPKLVTDDHQTIICDPTKIYSYFQASKQRLFRAVLLPKKEDNSWGLVLEDGDIVLFECTEKVSGSTYMPGINGGPNVLIGGGSVDNWFASRPGIGFFQLNTSLFGNNKKKKQSFLALISDDPVSVKAFEERTEYSAEFVRKEIRAYNERAAKRAADANANP